MDEPTSQKIAGVLRACAHRYPVILFVNTATLMEWYSLKPESRSFLFFRIAHRLCACVLQKLSQTYPDDFILLVADGVRGIHPKGLSHLQILWFFRFRPILQSCIQLSKFEKFFASADLKTKPSTHLISWLTACATLFAPFIHKRLQALHIETG